MGLSDRSRINIKLKTLISKECFVNFRNDMQCARCQSMFKPMTIYYVYEFVDENDNAQVVEYICSECDVKKWEK